MMLRRAFLTVQRRWKSGIISVLAMAVCAAALVALAGIGETSAARTAQRFIDLADKDVTAELPVESWTQDDTQIAGRLDGYPNLKAAGTLCGGNGDGTPVTIDYPARSTNASATIVVGTPTGLTARGGSLVSGTMPDETGGDVFTVAIGTRLASELGITSATISPTLQVNDTHVTVTGIIKDSPDKAHLATVIYMTPALAQTIGLLPSSRTIVLNFSTSPADSETEQLARALWPAQPGQVRVNIPANPTKLRDSLLSDTRRTSAIVAVMLAVMAIFSVSMTMLSAVNDRRHEIGISLALGLQPWKEGCQFLIESLILGFTGTLIGVLIGAQIAAGAALVSKGSYLIPVWTLLIPPGGALTGALAGLIPAWSAARTDPAILLREN